MGTSIPNHEPHPLGMGIFPGGSVSLVRKERSGWTGLCLEGTSSWKRTPLSGPFPVFLQPKASAG